MDGFTDEKNGRVKSTQYSANYIWVYRYFKPSIYKPKEECINEAAWSDRQ